MGIKPIRSEEEYGQALKEIERLWHAPVGSPEGERLEALVTRVEAWERVHYPVLPQERN